MTPQSRNAENALAFFQHFSERDMPALLALFSDDAVKENPFMKVRPADPGRTFQSKATIGAMLQRTFAQFTSMRFSVTELYDSPSANAVVVEATSEGHFVRPGVPPYRNRYIFVFKFNDVGEIIVYREFFDAILADEARDNFG